MSNTERIEASAIEFPHVDTMETAQVGGKLAEMERKLIFQTLQMTQQNKTKAAQILGISIRTLRNKLNEYKAEGVYESVV
jgi:two-component system response regulator FlrC